MTDPFRNFYTGEPLSQAEVSEMERQIDRVRRDVHEGRPERPRIVAPPDAYVLREAARDEQEGWEGKPELWKQVMGYHGFRWYEVHDLDAHPLVGPQRLVVKDVPGHFAHRLHEAGQWRNDLRAGSTRMGGHGFPEVPETLKWAFTLKDLIVGYGKPPDGPEVFDAWVRKQVLDFRMARAGLVSVR